MVEMMGASARRGLSADGSAVVVPLPQRLLTRRRVIDYMRQSATSCRCS